MSLARTAAPETLDALSGDDPLAQRSRRDLTRHDRLVLVASHRVDAMGANAATRGDAVLSVRAGFRDQALSRHWSSPEAGGQLPDRRHRGVPDLRGGWKGPA